MFYFLPAPMRGTICLVLLALNAVCIPIIITLVALLRWLIPIPIWRRFCYRLMNQLPTLWVQGNAISLRLFTQIKWHITGIELLDKKTWYFLVSNHRSWADILVLYHAFNKQAPPLKFFLKQQLIWVPGIGLACKALHFPFMQRYSKEYLKKHPEKKGRDAETTRQSCEAFKSHPSTIILFPETTRFTETKRHAQSSPFTYLLRPRTGMVALSLSVLGDHITTLMDVTIAYDAPNANMWDLLCGRIKDIHVDVNCLAIPNNLLHDTDKQTDLRKGTQQWLMELWEEKDRKLHTLFRQPTQSR